MTLVKHHSSETQRIAHILCSLGKTYSFVFSLLKITFCELISVLANARIDDDHVGKVDTAPVCGVFDITLASDKKNFCGYVSEHNQTGGFERTLLAGLRKHESFLRKHSTPLH